MPRSFNPDRPLTEADDSVYCSRDADRELAERLQRHDYVYIAEPGQQGKTSLLLKARRNPALRNLVFAYLSLAAGGTAAVDVQAWYVEISETILTQLEEDGRLAVRAGWRRGRPGDSAEWLQWLAEIARAGAGQRQPIVVLCDDVGTAVPDPNGFFAGLRSLYNRRLTNPDYQMLTFVLAGTFAHWTLISDEAVSPFNVAHACPYPTSRPMKYGGL